MKELASGSAGGLTLPPSPASLAIREEDWYLTAFLTPWGCFSFRYAPQIYVAADEAYTGTYDGVTAPISHKTKVIEETSLRERIFLRFLF